MVCIFDYNHIHVIAYYVYRAIKIGLLKYICLIVKCFDIFACDFALSSFFSWKLQLDFGTWIFLLHVRQFYIHFAL